jgi:hypothetical protein
MRRGCEKIGTGSEPKRRNPRKISGREGACPNFLTASECAYHFFLELEQLIPARSRRTGQIAGLCRMLPRITWSKLAVLAKMPGRARPRSGYAGSASSGSCLPSTGRPARRGGRSGRPHCADRSDRVLRLPCGSSWPENDSRPRSRCVPPNQIRQLLFCRS